MSVRSKAHTTAPTSAVGVIDVEQVDGGVVGTLLAGRVGPRAELGPIGKVVCRSVEFQAGSDPAWTRTDAGPSQGRRT